MKKFHKLSIKKKLILIILSISLFVLLLISGLFLFWEISHLRIVKMQNLTTTAKLVSDNCVVPLTFGDSEQGERALSVLINKPSVIRAFVYDQHLKPFATYFRNENDKTEIPQFGELEKEVTSENTLVKERIYFNDHHYGFIYLESDNVEVNRKIILFIKILVILFIFLLVVTYLLANKFQSIISFPIIELAEATRQITETGTYNLRLKKYSEDETGVLYDEFNAMFSQIEKHNKENLEAYQLLKKQHEMYLAIFNSFTEMIYVADIESGEIIFVNEKLIEEYGYDPTGKKFYQTFQGVDSPCNLCKNEQLKIGSKPIIKERYNDILHGFFIVTSQLINWPDGRDVRFEVAVNITERRAAEQEVKKLNEELEARVLERTRQLKYAVKELESFAYSVSHDLRTPLRSIDGFSQILIEDFYPKLNEEGRDYLLRVRKASQRMGILIDDILKLSRISRFELKRVKVNLSEIAESIVNELRQSDPLRKFEFKIQPEVYANGGEHLLKIAMNNLLENAWKYSSRKEVSIIEFGCEKRDGRKVYFVRDNGCGFDMKYSNKLFLPFNRLHSDKEFPGTGIGLATVLRVILRHEGDIWSESEPDKGATFYFNLSEKNEIV